MKPQPEASPLPPLRVGFLSDGLIVDAWVERMLARIDDAEYAEIALLVLSGNPRSDAEPPGVPRSPLRHRMLKHLNDPGVIGERSAFEPQSIQDRYAHVPRIRLESRKSSVDPCTEAEMTRLRSHGLDVLLCMNLRLMPDGISAIARYGVWSLIGGDGRDTLGGSVGIREVLEGTPTSGAALIRLVSGTGRAEELDRTRTATHPTSISHNRETLSWTALSLVPRALKRLHRDGEKTLSIQRGESATTLNAADPKTESLESMSLPGLTTRLLGLWTRRMRRSLRHRLYEEQWHLRYAFENSPSLGFARFASLRSPGDRFWADPMPVYHDGRWHIFFEDYRPAVGRGRISMISFDENLAPQPAREALVRPYHLSYPHVFHWDDRLWMIPETASNRTVELYECLGFPDQWELRRQVLRDHYIVDSTLVRHGTTWYLFTNEVENPGASSWTETFLYLNQGDLLDGDWTPHPDNPIRSDATCARPAGPLFHKDGKLFRPAQDCSRRYGGAMVIHEITEMSPERYAEHTVARIQADWEPGLQGTHTFSHRPGLTVIDVLREVPRSKIWKRMPDWVHRALTRPLMTSPKDRKERG